MSRESSQIPRFSKGMEKVRKCFYIFLKDPVSKMSKKQLSKIRIIAYNYLAYFIKV
jgi:hypothetical protein